VAPPAGGIADVRIGVLHTPKEIEVNLPDDTDCAEVRARMEAALANGDAVLWLTDRLGTEIAVPAERIARVQLGSVEADRRIGFCT